MGRCWTEEDEIVVAEEFAEAVDCSEPELLAEEEFEVRGDGSGAWREEAVLARAR